MFIEMLLKDAVAATTTTATTDVNLNSVGGILTLAALIVGSAYKGITWLNQQNKKREEDRSKQIEERAKKLREETEERARQLQQAVDRSAEIMKNTIDQRDKDFKELYFKEHAKLKESVTTLGNDVRGMFIDLSRRADLTNGNVAHIRNDMSDLAADIQELFEKVDPEVGTKDALKASRDKDVRRRERKRQIEADRIEQVHPGETSSQQH